MPNFNQNPILNSPYREPEYHWELGENGNMLNKRLQGRRKSKYIIPVPAPEDNTQQQQNLLPQEEEERTKVNRIREQLKEWRAKPPADRAHISNPTKKLLAHWQENASPRLFFCQLEAAETLIWLNDVAPKTKQGKDLIRHLRDTNNEANPGLSEKNPDLFRLAAKMATGAGKTTVMAMLIAYHAVNKARKPDNPAYAAHFLIITPGITIKDRLRVLLPNDPDNYYENRGIVPRDGGMLEDVKKAEIVITNYHSFKRREKHKLSKQQRDIIAGNDDIKTDNKESDGIMLKRVCPELLKAKNVVIINDEAHHCYIHRKQGGEEPEVTGDEREDVARNDEAARLWINGIKVLGRKLKIQSVYDLSATPFFLRGSGYREGTLFPWVASDFSLMEAIESGVVKLPRVPVRDAATLDKTKMPIYRNLYEHIRGDLPKSGRGAQADMDPQKLPAKLLGALQVLSGHYEETYESWKKEGVGVPPVFIVVCNNTSTSKLIYDYISGYQTNGQWRAGKFPLLNNVADGGGKLRARPRTLLIDSYQLESGETLTDEFKKAAAAEIEIFHREMRARYPERPADKITNEDLLREVMNTVGRKERLGEQIRCVVSVSMLTEGWDTNNVTHILGVRAFGTQLLCEQVVGRALRRFDYEPNDEDKFTPEYAEVFGVPFSFMSDAPAPAPKPPKRTIRVRHLDERRMLAIFHPALRGYRVQPPEGRLIANFTENSRYTIDANTAPPITKQQGIAGDGKILTMDKLKEHRETEVAYSLAAYVANRYYPRDDGGAGVAPSRFRDLMPIVRRYMSDYITCNDNTFVQYLLWEEVAQEAAARIYRATTEEEKGEERILPVMDPFNNEEGSTFNVDFLTAKTRLHKTAEDKSHINIAVCDSDWELNFCKYLESDPGVFSYTRTDGMQFKVPYTLGEVERNYIPDFIVRADDGNGNGNSDDDLLNLVIEIKGFRGDDARVKADTMERLWIPAVTNAGKWGRWQFLEIMDMQDARQKLAQYTQGGKHK